jgi:uncharacterized protein (TIGR03435 family)
MRAAAVAAAMACAVADTARAQDAGGSQRVTMMAVDADPDWEVVSVKARDPNDTSNSQSMNMQGRQFVIVNRTVEGMLMFAYGMHKKQIVGGPGWIATQRWDVQGVPDVPGNPSLKQTQSLTRKLLEERFGLKVDKETRELAVYAITVAKGGEKMARSTGDPNGTPDESSSGGVVTMRMTNMSMGEFCAGFGVFSGPAGGGPDGPGGTVRLPVEVDRR